VSTAPATCLATSRAHAGVDDQELEGLRIDHLLQVVQDAKRFLSSARLCGE